MLLTALLMVEPLELPKNGETVLKVPDGTFGSGNGGNPSAPRNSLLKKFI
jgi:hypothetical protein